MFDDIFTDQVKSAIGVARPDKKVDVEKFAELITDRFGSLSEGREGEVKLVARYVAENWPEEYRLTTAIQAVPWARVFKSIDSNELSMWFKNEKVGPEVRGDLWATALSNAEKTIVYPDRSSEFLQDFSAKVDQDYITNAADALAQNTGVTPEEALATTEARGADTLTDKLLVSGEFLEDLTIEGQIALEPGVDMSSLVMRGLEYETPLDLSALPGFDLLEVADQWTAADTLSYITDIDQTARMKLQDLLEGAGYFDQAREMGHVSARDGTNDVATQVAWQQFLADAVLNGETNMQSWLTERTRTMRSRSMASVQEVYRDPASINTLIDSVSMGLLGRTLDVQERSSLLGTLMDWQREALLGPTYTQERYDVDLQARAKEYFDKQFMKERMQNRTDEFLYKIGALGG